MRVGTGSAYHRHRLTALAVVLAAGFAAIGAQLANLQLVSGDHLAALSVTSGLLRLVQATPAGYRELAKVEVLNRGARADTPPSFAAGHLFVRNDEEIVAVRVGS